MEKIESMDKVEITVIGAGVVGLAIARELATRGKSVLILEKNEMVGMESSSRNSCIIHAGIYYPTGSSKARLCVEGKKLLYAYCEKMNIAHNRTGKLIVASTQEEENQLELILQQAKANKVTDLEFITQDKLRQLEPNVKASKALFSPSTGIIDIHNLMQAYLAEAESHGATLAVKTSVEQINRSSHGFIITANSQGEHYQFESEQVVNTAGFGAQALAEKTQGVDPGIIPSLHFCKGNYFSITGKSPFKHLIYPVPEKQGRGLGIHATLDLSNQVRFGPDTEYIDELDYNVSTQRHDAFKQAISRYYPEIANQTLTPDYAGIRSKIQGPKEGPKDFMIQDEMHHGIPGLVQLFGIESPGLTASMAIGREVREIL